MDLALIPPASGHFLFIPAFIIYTLIPVAGITLFIYMIVMRLKPMIKAQPDMPLSDIPKRLVQLVKIWLLQYRQPRYMMAGMLHIFLFAGFLILGARSMEMMFIGIKPGFHLPGAKASWALFIAS